MSYVAVFSHEHQKEGGTIQNRREKQIVVIESLAHGAKRRYILLGPTIATNKQQTTTYTTSIGSFFAFFVDDDDTFEKMQRG